MVVKEWTGLGLERGRGRQGDRVYSLYSVKFVEDLKQDSDKICFSVLKAHRRVGSKERICSKCRDGDS